ncbi:phosphoglycerate kinase, partial [Zhongshania sp.]|uniref:phosphoglycerate kinase n=1 Tax=Zhongshania sp. TaxID=1971902 RepID=UPI0035660009
MKVIKMSDVDLGGKRVLIREDLNVPIKDGKVSSDARLRAALPTLKLALAAGAQVIVMSHLGRPTEGEFEEKYSLKPVADYLGEALGQDVALLSDWQNGVDLADGQLALLENVRFNKGEKK